MPSVSSPVRQIAELFTIRLFRHNSSKRIYVVSLILLALVTVAIVSGYLFGFHVSRSKAASTEQHQSKAVLSERVSVQAAGRGNPWINFNDGREVIADYSGPAELQQVLERNQAQARSLASADFDEDGVPDLVSGYAAPIGGIITLHRGNIDSIYPNSLEAKQRRASGELTDSPFLSPARVFSLAAVADFIGAGDFDADGHWDVVAATRGGNKLYLLRGDGKGGLSTAEEIELPGKVYGDVGGGDQPHGWIGRHRRRGEWSRRSKGAGV